MTDLCVKIIQAAFGNNCSMQSCSIITDGYKNTTYKLTCSGYSAPLFLKIEKPFKIPRTQAFQIKKEVAGINLCNKAGIPVPNIVMSDEDGKAFGVPWILEDFIDEKLICERWLSEPNKKTLGNEFEDIYTKISNIASDFYGDTFNGGFIGRHLSWNDAIAKITQLSYQDGLEIGVFGDKAHVVDMAIKKALKQIKSNLEPVLFHCDLFSANIMGAEKNGQVRISHIIDFGMSMFASRCFSHYITWKHTDFAVAPVDIGEMYGISHNELAAYDILRLEPALLTGIIKFDGYDDFISSFIQKCEKYALAD